MLVSQRGRIWWLVFTTIFHTRVWSKDCICNLIVDSMSNINVFLQDVINEQAAFEKRKSNGVAWVNNAVITINKRCFVNTWFGWYMDILFWCYVISMNVAYILLDWPWPYNQGWGVHNLERKKPYKFQFQGKRILFQPITSNFGTKMVRE